MSDKAALFISRGLWAIAWAIVIAAVILT